MKNKANLQEKIFVRFVNDKGTMSGTYIKMTAYIRDKQFQYENGQEA